MTQPTQPLYPLRLYRKKYKVIVPLGISFALNLLIWAWLFWNIRPQDQHIFLHYNILFGVDFLGEWWRVYALPAAGLLILFVNAVLGWLLYAKDSFVATLLNVTSLLVQIALLMAAWLLVFLNV